MVVFISLKNDFKIYTYFNIFDIGLFDIQIWRSVFLTLVYHRELILAVRRLSQTQNNYCKILVYCSYL
jgi:hypothetical protein